MRNILTEVHIIKLVFILNMHKVRKFLQFNKKVNARVIQINYHEAGTYMCTHAHVFRLI